nr:reverse transcriptase domain-containing protein [Tanacetum cinerariifolium]
MTNLDWINDAIKATLFDVINHYQTAKEILDPIKKLMEGTELTLQERESKPYDEFDRFTSKLGELIYSYYYRYAKLINDINIIKMSMAKIQVNTKFVNHLQPQWNAKEVREMRQRFLDPLALVANTYNPPSSYSSQRSRYDPLVVPQQQPTLLTQPDSRFVVPSFVLTDDPIASLNKAMLFISLNISSRYPPINNQIRTLSNPRTQETIQNGQVIVQNVQGRQPQGYAVNTGKSQATGTRVINTVVEVNANQPREIRCYNCRGEGLLNVQSSWQVLLSEVPHYNTYHENDVLNSVVQEAKYIENFISNNDSYDELTNDNNVISYADYMVTIINDAAQYVPSPAQENVMLLSIVEIVLCQILQRPFCSYYGLWRLVDWEYFDFTSLLRKDLAITYSPLGNSETVIYHLRTMEELCQPSLNGRGGPIAPIAIQAMIFGLKNDMIQQVHNSFQFHGLPALKAEMAEINKNLMSVIQVNQQVKAVTPNCKTCGGPHSFSDCPATVGNTQNANDAILKNMQTNMTSLTNSNLELKNMIGQFMKMNTALSSGSRTLPGNTITNLKELKGITTRSGTAYQGPTIPTTYSSPVVERKTEATKDMLHPNNNGSTEDVQPLVVPTESLILNSEPVISPIIEPVASPVSTPRPNQKPIIPYPSRLKDQKLRDKANDQQEKFFQIFKDLNFNISFVDALILMPKFGPSIKILLIKKDKLCELPRTLLNKHCLTVLLKKLPEKLGDPDKFLIPCDFPEMAECLALSDLGASINLMPLSVWIKLSLPDLSPTYMTLELVDRSISHPVGVAKDVFVKVGTFHFPADFVVVDFDADSRVPLILGRSFLKTGRALINVFEGELSLRVGKEAITFNLDQTSRYSANYNDMTTNRIDVIDMACKEYSQEVLGFFDVIASGNPTPYYDPIVSTTSPTLTPFGNSDFLLGEVDAFLALEDDPTSPEVDQSYVDNEGDILLLEAFLNDDPSLPPLNQENYLPQVLKELKICEAKSDKSSIDEPPERCMMAIFHDMIEKTIEVFMDDFSVFRNSFQTCLSHLEKMLKRCEDTNLCLNWEKSHFMVKEGIVIGHKISKNRIEVDKAKVDVITKLPHPTTVKVTGIDLVTGTDLVARTDLVTKAGTNLVKEAGTDLVTSLRNQSSYEAGTDLNDWYKKCEECKYDKISYDKVYNDMQQKIKRLQAQLEDLNGKSKDTSCVSDTLNPLSQKLENENVELEFQDRAHFDVGFPVGKDDQRPARAMTRLLEKDTPFLFSKECVEAFQTLKRKLTEAPILIAPDWDMTFELVYDASDFAIGAVLGQRQEKHFRPIHYANKTITEA